MEVLYWRHVKEQLETLQKLRRREASTGRGGPGGPGGRDGSGLTVSAQAAEQWLPRAEEGLWPAEEDRLEDSLEELGEAGGCTCSRVGARQLRTGMGLTCLLLGPLGLPADDFLEPEECTEPEGAQPVEAADLGRSGGTPLRTGEGEVGVAHSSHCPFSRSRGHASVPELRGAGPKERGRPWLERAGSWGGPTDGRLQPWASVGTLHHDVSEVRPGDGAEPACQGLGDQHPAPAAGAGEGGWASCCLGVGAALLPCSFASGPCPPLEGAARAL